MNKSVFSWFFRFIKGMLIGTGAILPGVSGGALAAVFGIYERIISFVAHIKQDFKKNVFFLLPVGLGALFGIFLLSVILSFFFEKGETQIIWFFIGCIIGIIPALFSEAGKKGRSGKHIIIMLVTMAVSLVFLFKMKDLVTTNITLNFLNWCMAGAIFALGLVIPGLSPSNFLLYMGMYKPMVDGIKMLDFSVIIPLIIGAVLTILLLSKLFDYIFRKAYSAMFHTILGIVIASTVMIIPRDYNYLSFGFIGCLAACIFGLLLGLWMSNLEKKYKL